MKQKCLLLILFLFSRCFSVFPLTFKDFSLENLDFQKTAIFNKEFSLLDLKSYKYFFAPKAYFDLSGNLTGNLIENEDFFTNANILPKAVFSLNLPSMIELDFSTSLGIDFYNNDSQVFYKTNPEISFSVPLVLKNEIIKNYNDFSRNYYLSKKNEILINYQIEILEGIQNYISNIGNYLYYKELIELNDKKIEFLEKLNFDYEKLFESGRITSIELEEQYSDLNSLSYEQTDCKIQLISAEKLLLELGIKINENFCFSEFVNFWENYFSEFSKTFDLDKLELLRLENARLKNAENAKSSVSFLTCGFSILNNHDNNFLNVENSTWQFDLSVKIPCFPSFFNNFEQKQNLINNSLYEIEKSKLIRKQKASESYRKTSAKMYKTYIETTKKNVQLEKNRYESYKKLNEIGRLSNFNLEYQKNVVDFAELNELYARFKFVVFKAGMY